MNVGAHDNLCESLRFGLNVAPKTDVSASQPCEQEIVLAGSTSSAFFIWGTPQLEYQSLIIMEAGLRQRFYQPYDLTDCLMIEVLFCCSLYAWGEGRRVGGRGKGGGTLVLGMEE